VASPAPTDHPSTATTLTSPEVLRRLQLTVTRRLDGILHGDVRGLVPGHGSEPGETRIYEPGDDVRRIDWNVTARMQTPHLRQSIADRELSVTLVIDRSSSLSWGTALRTKDELVLSAAAAVGFLTARGGNRVGGWLLTADGPVLLPPRPGREPLMALLERLGRTAAPIDRPAAVDLTAGLAHAAKATRRRGLVVVISDFLPASGNVPGASDTAWERPLRAIAHRHECLVVEVVDPRELELPAVGTLPLSDTETGRTRVIHLTPQIRADYAAAAATQRRDIADRIRRAGASHLRLRTDRDWLVDIARFLADRRRS
jgi:uncharacterized protein (DUF58 family)